VGVTLRRVSRHDISLSLCYASRNKARVGLSHQYWPVAQLVEHSSPKQGGGHERLRVQVPSWPLYRGEEHHPQVFIPGGGVLIAAVGPAGFPCTPFGPQARRGETAERRTVWWGETRPDRFLAFRILSGLCDTPWHRPLTPQRSFVRGRWQVCTAVRPAVRPVRASARRSSRTPSTRGTRAPKVLREDGVQCR
jgi:hypothetical protein